MLDRIVAAQIVQSSQHVMLLGPRQTGKSTLARSTNPVFFVNLADEGIYLSYQRDPRLFGREVRALREPGVIVIDEVQRIPSLLNTLQALIDEQIGGHRYILTGSSARKLRKGGANLLPGRVVQERLTPLLIPELGERFNLEHALRLGTLPGIYLAGGDGELLLESYANTYLREEIQAEGLVENLGGFARLLDVIAASSGTWLNYSKLASETEIPKETIRRYVSILEDTLVLERLEAFRPGSRIDRRVRQKEKIFLFDLGVRNALLRLHRTELPPTMQGVAFEHLIVLQILGLTRAYHRPWKLSSFLGSRDQEVDLVIDQPDRVIGIEIKRGHQLHDRRSPGFALLADLCQGYKPLYKYIVYTGERRFSLEDGVEVVPFWPFLVELFA